MKKTSLTLATFSLLSSLGAYAAIPADAPPYQLAVPNLKSGLALTLEGLYLQPSSANLDYASVVTEKKNNLHTDNIQTIDPDYNFGFRVGLGYVFGNSGNDIQLNWTRFDQSYSNATTVPDLGAVITPLNYVNTVDKYASNYDREEAFDWQKITGGKSAFIYDKTNVSSEAKFKLDSIDLDIGQYVDVGARLHMRMFTGLRVAQVRNDQTNIVNAAGAFSINDALDENFTYKAEGEYSGQEIEEVNSKFTGIGPRFGVDSNYHIGNGFGIVAHAAVGLLIGKVDANTTMTEALAGNAHVEETFLFFDDQENFHYEEFNELQNKVELSSNSDSVTRIVPTLDGKLGFDYSYAFQNNSVVSLEAGWQWTQYINAVDKLMFNIDEPDLATIRSTSSVGFDGPYLALNWKI